MSGTKPEISVVMSVYNYACDLSETMESILSQQDVDFEFIVVNDGSTDDTGKILDDLAYKDSRVRVIHQHNTGLTVALIAGCAQARAPYIARQDAGDASLPGRLSFQKKALDESGDLAFVSCWTEFCGPEGEFLFLEKGTGKARSPLYILSPDSEKGVIDGPSSHPSVMFRREAYVAAGGYRKEFYFGQDWDLWYRLAEKGKFQMIEQPLYRASVASGSISGKHREFQQRIASLSRQALTRRLAGDSDAEVLSEAAQIRKKGDNKSDVKSEAAWLYFIGECLRRNRDARAIGYLFQSVRRNPVSAKTWIRLLQSLPMRLSGN